MPKRRLRIRVERPAWLFPAATCRRAAAGHSLEPHLAGLAHAERRAGSPGSGPVVHWCDYRWWFGIGL